MTTTFFTADLHLGHKTVAKLRGYEDPDAHDLMILSGIAGSVSKGDNLWVLGDLSSGGSVPQRRALKILDDFAEINGINLHLVSGNHDGVHPLHRDSHKWTKKYAEVFESVQPFARRRLAGRNLWLSHFPWRGGGDHTEGERYSTVRLNDDGTSWLLHGHTHNPAPIRPDERMIHVGVEAWCFQPVSIHEIEELIREHDVLAAPSQANKQEDEMTSEAPKHLEYPLSGSDS